jgi:hypothetical protein
MIRAVFIFPSLLALASCAGDPFGAKPAQAWPVPTQVARGHIDFDWLLSGDRAVAPLQVFNDAGSTWLQFARGQSLPAIFAVVQGQEAVVPYVWQEPYAVLAGRWPEIVLRGGRLTARARYGAQLASLPAPGALPVGEAAREEGPPRPGGADPSAVQTALSAGAVALAALEVPVPGAPVPNAIGLLAALPTGAAPQEAADRQKARYISALEAAGPVAPSAVPLLPTAASPAFPGSAAGAKRAPAPARSDVSALPAISAVTFGAGPQDVNMRRALTRWARLAGWTFSPQHWAVDADIPLAGSAELGADFKLAVNRLLESTELSDRPAHPCFYSNRVLRVLPLAEPCVRAAVASERPS